jgi:hypothetical protein
VSAPEAEEDVGARGARVRFCPSKASKLSTSSKASKGSTRDRRGRRVDVRLH